MNKKDKKILDSLNRERVWGDRVVIGIYMIVGITLTVLIINSLQGGAR